VKRENREIFAGILLGGVIAGAADIAAASMILGRSPAFIAQLIAGGLLGKATFAGGMQTVMLGIALQEAMGILIAAAYAALSGFAPVLRRRWVTGGLAYGVVIFFVMNYIVVPLSAWRSTPHFTLGKFVENMAAMLLFGLFVAFFSRRTAETTEQQSNAAKTAA
jgi:hypothetical protein